LAVITGKGWNNLNKKRISLDILKKYSLAYQALSGSEQNFNKNIEKAGLPSPHSCIKSKSETKPN
jgi:hypothetical protein